MVMGKDISKTGLRFLTNVLNLWRDEAIAMTATGAKVVQAKELKKRKSVHMFLLMRKANLQGNQN